MTKVIIKKLALKILDTFGITKAASVSASDFITISSGWTVSNVEVIKLGRITMWRSIFQNPSAMANGTQQRVGTIKSPYRALSIAGLTSISFLGLTDTTGAVYLRNVSGTSLPAGQQTNVCGIYFGELGGGSQ